VVPREVTIRTSLDRQGRLTRQKVSIIGGRISTHCRSGQLGNNILSIYEYRPAGRGNIHMYIEHILISKYGADSRPREQDNQVKQ